MKKAPPTLSGEASGNDLLRLKVTVAVCRLSNEHCSFAAFASLACGTFYRKLMNRLNNYIFTANILTNNMGNI